MATTGKKKGLGKGLEALIPHWQDVEQETGSLQHDQVRMIPLEKIYPNENQPRKAFEPEALNDLASSLRQHGMIQPILVAKNKRGT